MGEKIVVGPFAHGIKNYLEQFYIDNDSFPVLRNAYQQRGRIKRKRGTSLLNRAKRFFNSTSVSYNSGSTTITLNGSGSGNLLTGFSLETNGNIVPTTVTITAPGPTVYTDPAGNGTLSPSGSINYATGSVTIAAEANNAVSATFNYYPDRPILGIEDFIRPSTDYPGTVIFDDKYSYLIVNSEPYDIYDVSFYKNPAASSSMPSYVQKTNWTPTSWNGNDYQQYWTCNFQGAMWTTNTMPVPFSSTNIGMQFKAVTGLVIVAAGPPATATVTILSHGLSIGDFLFFNEITGTTGINFQTGYVTGTPTVDTVTVVFPNATLGGAYTNGGIAQYLTNRSDTTKDCLRFFDGDPTNSDVNTPVLNGTKGWVNFCPPLSNDNFSIADLPLKQYYLVGAKLIVPFKDRLLFFGPVVQQSQSSTGIYLKDTVIYSQNGTPYYTASFTGDPALPTTTYTPLLVPDNQTATPNAYWGDITGYGGWQSAGIDEKINSISINEDVLIAGFDKNQVRVVYTGIDYIPFTFYIINSEYGTSSQFSAVNLDKGVLSRSARGHVITSQTQCQRFDMDIPDEIYQVSLLNNGMERVTAARDFINEWVYFSYPDESFGHKFPSQTLQYNYRDNSWGVFNESYTTYGSFQQVTGDTWATIGDKYATWNVWNDPWNSGESNLLQPQVIAGNQQGFVLLRGVGTGEGNSLYIRNISSNTVTSPNHGLNENDYIIISGCLGATEVNNKIFSVNVVDADSFTINPNITTSAYLGGGVIKRLYVPFIQTKQFPVAWQYGRKTRIGPQMYLFTTTDDSQVQLLIFLSQNSSSPYNESPILPVNDSVNDALIYSTVLYTCPESTNLGLSAPNVNLQMPTAIQQNQIWHRMNTSLIGDTVQIGFTLSEDQMRDTSFIPQFAEIELHGMILDVSPSQLLV